jgi:predicted metal-dependent hydrolase
MELVREAFNALFPEKPYPYSAVVEYSGKFNGYNARISLNKLTKQIRLRLSRQWQGVSRGIQIGLVQHLLVRLFREKRRTTQMDLYAHFMRAIPKTVAKTITHPVLEQSFQRVNNVMFNGLLEQPNLSLGQGTTKLGHYDIGTDTVSISSSLLEHPRLMDYVMYHELLHKKHQFSGTGIRHTFHSKAFRDEEKKFPDSHRLEKELARVVSRKRLPSFLSWFS